VPDGVVTYMTLTCTFPYFFAISAIAASAAPSSDVYTPLSLTDLDTHAVFAFFNDVTFFGALVGLCSVSIYVTGSHWLIAVPFSYLCLSITHPLSRGNLYTETAEKASRRAQRLTRLLT
jgi:hypothetical protein